MNFTSTSAIAVLTLLIVYIILITEKVNKVLVAILGAAFLIFAQVYKSTSASSEENAFHYVSKNLDILGFIIGMMLLVGIVKQSGIFEAIAIWLVKMVKGDPNKILIAIGYLTFVMTVFLSNIPTILIITPVILVLIKQFKLPYFPFIFTIITMANIAGSVSPISDPTTYYQSKTVGLGFLEVVSNSGLIAFLLSFVTIAYVLILFKKPLSQVKVKPEDIQNFSPAQAIKNRKIMMIGVPVLAFAISLMTFKDFLGNLTGIRLDNGIISLSAAFLCMLVFNINPEKALKDMIDWGIIFFFIGLFIIVGALEFTGVTEKLAAELISLTNGNQILLLLLITVGSAVLSVFIDNVPYNITMVDLILKMQSGGVNVYPLWWGLNLGTSIGGSGSIIGAACNVVAVGQVEEAGFHLKFMKYLKFGFPLVVLNGFITFGILYLRFLYK
jgi:Na+/H+ antiporter NhaD/arsenite permease-like protein